MMGGDNGADEFVIDNSDVPVVATGTRLSRGVLELPDEGPCGLEETAPTEATCLTESTFARERSSGSAKGETRMFCSGSL